MKTVYYKIIILIAAISFFGLKKSQANGCTGSYFQIVYSPWCDCYQVCGNFISDCDKLKRVTFNFGDGTPPEDLADPNNPTVFPCHKYTVPGNYTITMTVVGYCHGLPWTTTTCNITQQVNVPTVHSPLTAEFAMDTVCLQDGMHFTNTSITPGGYSDYVWDFGDGTTSTLADPTHTFDSCGTFTVKLIVKNQVPCCALQGADTIEKIVHVNCPPDVAPNIVGTTDPYITLSHADITVLGGTCAGDTTRFLLTPHGSIDSWTWVFPDSSTSTSATPSYHYTDCPPAVPFTKVYLVTDHGCRGIIDSVTGIFCPSNIGLAQTTTLCKGECTGTASVIMSGGTPPYSFSWNDPQHQVFSTAINLCPGPYNVVVTDGNGCTATPGQPVTVLDFPTFLAGTPAIYGGVRCNGWIGGSAVLTMTGGTPPYSFLWPNGVNNDSTENLPGGPGTVFVTDAHACKFSAPFTIPQPPPITATFTVVDASCGVCDGTAAVNASGGQNLGYWYRWITTNPIQTTQTAINLCAGVYLVEVEDATVTGCMDTFSVTVADNGATPITASSTNAQCVNICNGTATANGCGGCTYVWFDSTATSINQNAQNASNLCAGNYSVQATNGIGCKSFATTTVTVPNPVVTSTTTVPNGCGGNCNGSITASASGGTGGYTYQWLDGSNNVIAGQTNSTINSLCNGSYTARVTDSQGCIDDAAASIFGSPMTVSTLGSSVKCNGDSNGIITVIVTWGTTPYTYVVRNGSGATIYSGASSIIANLGAGNYTVDVTDAGNCTISTPVSITQPTVLNELPSATAPLCFGNCNGTVSVVANGGTPPYTYEWKNTSGAAVPGGTAPIVNNLCAGTYVVRTTDSNSCATAFIPVPLVQPNKLEDSLHIVNPYCNVGQGSIDAIVTGGAGGYSYSWNNGTYTTASISGLGTGTYKIVVTDANNCSISDSTTFIQLPNLIITVIPTNYNGYNFKCLNGTDGEVVVRVQGGQPPYTYLWNDSLKHTVDSIFGLTAGTYTVTVSDANGCERVDSVTLNQIPPLFTLDVVSRNPLCAGDSNGTLTLTPLGGIPPYTWFWDVDTTFNNQLTNLGQGTYIAYAYDANHCLRSDTTTLTEPTALAVSNTHQDAGCLGSSDGSIDITVTGGVTPYTYSWNGGAYTVEDPTAIPAGQYIAVISDSSNCTIGDTVTISQHQAVTTSLSSTIVTCFNGADGTVNLTVNGAIPPLTYSWNNGQYTTEDLQGVSAGKYVVLVVDSINCQVSDSIDVTEAGQITGDRQITICITDSLFVGGGYQSTPGSYYDTLVAPNGCDSVLRTDLSFIDKFETSMFQTICYGQSFKLNGISYNASGTYIDTLKSSGGCDSIVTLNLNAIPDIKLYAVPEEASISYGESVSVSAVTSSLVHIDHYNWSPATWLSCSDCQTAEIEPPVSTIYFIEAVDSNGCRDTVAVPIHVKGGTVFVPNVFTPNADGNNDYFTLFGNLKPLLFMDIMVFNRIGEKVFESNDHDFAWDGTYKGKDAPQAVYVWVLKLRFIDSPTEEVRKGSVTLLR